MRRDAMAALQAWKNDPGRKPLILRGARQVGKTWLMKEFGFSCYTNTVYLNFERELELREVFQKSKEPAKIIAALELIKGQKISPGETLIIFDEVQECPEALNALKYFREEAPSYHIMAAGSLLGTLLSTPQGYPVGQVNLLTIYPMSFGEFLQATDEALGKYYSELSEPEDMYEIMQSRLAEAYHHYQIVGGLPECVSTWIQYHDAGRVRDRQQELLQLYENDITKHNGRVNAGRILLVWRSLVPQLAKANEKFVYGVVRKGARAREFEEAIEWLVSAGLVYRVTNISQPVHPLPAYDVLNSFKLFCVDIGLLKQMAGVSNEAIMLEQEYQFRGVMAENFVLQQLLGKLEVAPRYFSPSAVMEIDFVLQQGSRIIPVEVKAGKAVASPSFKAYRNKYKPEHAVRFSTKGFMRQEKLVNVPIYLAGRPELYLE